MNFHIAKHANPKAGRRRGVSIIEAMIALAITAMLLTATAVAINASFRAYASAAEQASSQSASRMVSHRLLTLIRTSTAHGPLNAQSARSVVLEDPENPDITYNAAIAATVTDSSLANTVVGPYMELIDPDGNHLAVMLLVYDKRAPGADVGETRKEIWLIENPDDTRLRGQPLLGGVTNATFHCTRRLNSEGLWVLERGTIDFTVTPDADATLALERGDSTPIRFVASTMPRKLD